MQCWKQQKWTVCVQVPVCEWSISWSHLTSPGSWGLHWSSSSTLHPHNPNTWGRHNISMQLIQETQRDYRASKSFPVTSNILQDRDKSVSKIHSPLVAQSNHTLVSRTGHNCLFWLHVNRGLALWYSRHHKTQLVDSDHTYCWTSLTSPTMSKGVRFYLLYHLFLDGFFDILDFLPFVTINQHDLTQEYTFYRSKCHYDAHSAITI